MAKEIKPVLTTTGTGSTTDITYTGLGASTNIDGAIIWITGCTAEDTDTTDMALSMSFYDGTNMTCLANQDDGGSANSVGYDARRVDKVAILDQTGAIESLGTLSKITDGVRITWDSGLEPASNWKVMATLFAGGIDVAVGTIQMPTVVDNTVDFTTSFTADVVFTTWGYIGTIATLPSLNGDHNNRSLGVCVNDGSLTQASVMSWSDHGRISGQYESEVRDDKVFASTNNPVENSIAAITSTYVRFNKDAGTNNSIVAVMAIGGLDDVHLSTSTTDFDTDTAGSQSISGIGFEPTFAITCRDRATTLNTQYTNLNQEARIGICDDTDEYCYNSFGDDGSATTDVWQRIGNKFIDSYQGEGEAIQATFTSFDSGGITLNVGTAGISNGWILLMRVAAAAPPATDDSVPWMSFF